MYRNIVTATARHTYVTIELGFFHGVMLNYALRHVYFYLLSKRLTSYFDFIFVVRLVAWRMRKIQPGAGTVEGSYMPSGNVRGP